MHPTKSVLLAALQVVVGAWFTGFLVATLQRDFCLIFFFLARWLDPVEGSRFLMGGSTVSLGAELQLAQGGRALSDGEVKCRRSGRYLPL